MEITINAVLNPKLSFVLLAKNRIAAKAKPSEILDQGGTLSAISKTDFINSIGPTINGVSTFNDAEANVINAHEVSQALK